MTKPTLKPEAAALLAQATAALATIGTTPHELRAILYAAEIAEAMADTEDWPDDEDANLDDYVSANSDGAYDVYVDDACAAAAFLIDGAVSTF